MWHYVNRVSTIMCVLYILFIYYLWTKPHFKILKYYHFF